MPGILNDSRTATLELESLLADNLLGGFNKAIIRKSTKLMTPEEPDASPPKGVLGRDWNRL